MRIIHLAAAGLILAAACSTAEDRRLDAARADLPGALRDAGCDSDATPPQFQEDSCNAARYACADGPTPDTFATADACEAAVAGLDSASTEGP